MMNAPTKLLLTVSGGLEELVEKQIHSLFQNDEELLGLDWRKGPSGSQLYLTLLCKESMETKIAECLKSLDFVDYVYVLLGSVDFHHSIQKSDDNAMELLRKEIQDAASTVSQPSVDFCTRICEYADKGEGSKRSSLEGLPGLLLPSPGIDSESPSPTITNQGFAVNTIYTQATVAKMVVRAVADFNSQYCIKSETETDDTLWLDAGSGNGALLEYLPPQSSVGVDTHPTSSRVKQMDFLKISKSWLQQEFPRHKHLVVVSNPPFSVSSRGDYSPIVQFINHSFDVLEAEIVAVICPTKFARQRIWKSLGMTEHSHLLARFLLPNNAFFSPTTGQTIHIHSFCLIFGRNSTDQTKLQAPIMQKSGVYVSAKRDKSCFARLSTADLTSSIVAGLAKAGVELAAERNARYILHAKLATSLELWWNINPRQPCSLMNSNSIQVPNHSLGWLSLSCQPPMALAMSSLALENEGSNKKSRLVVNLMSGEGTVELEASRASEDSFFMIAGDKSLDRAQRTAQRIQSLKDNGHDCPIIDVVVWDAQRLPLRKGIADAVIADLPFQGSRRKAHQEAVVGDSVPEKKSSLNYSQILGFACRILQPKGRAALLSPDCKALQHASAGFNWSPLWYSKNVNLGGLSGKFFLMERREACSKDVCLLVSSSSADLSPWILALAKKACRRTEDEESSPVTSVRLLNTFFHDQTQSLSHCYRICFDDGLKNSEAKKLEKQIRLELEENLLEDMSLG